MYKLIPMEFKKMSIVSGSRAILSLSRSVALQRRLTLPPIEQTSAWLPRRLCTHKPTPERDKVSCSKEKTLAACENISLLEKLSLLGVDVNKARQRQPGVLRKTMTNEQGVVGFLQDKGASREVIAGIISRFPRAITRSGDHLEQRWALWRRVFTSDSEVVDILDRSPESFFRSSDNVNLEKNITFLSSLGFDAKGLHRLLTTAPRTFSNSAELNRQMVELLEEVGAELGLSERTQPTPEGFAKEVICKNVYILIRSTKRVRSNINVLRSELCLNDAELLAVLRGPGAEILDLSTVYLSRNLNSFNRKMVSLGCSRADVKRLVVAYPMVLYIRAENLSGKLDILLQGGITIQQVVEKPKVLDYSAQNIAVRIEELQRLGYDFRVNGITILDSSRKRFDAKMVKLGGALQPPPQEEGG